MKFQRERVSIAEVQAADPATIYKMMEFYESSVGDHFFFIDRPDKVWVVEAEFADNPSIYTYDGGKEFDNSTDEYRLLPSVVGMIDVLAYYGAFELRAHRDRWIAILENHVFFESVDGEDLVAFLWRVWKAAVTEVKYD
ncbi:hypothetical protein [Paenibacillus sp. IHBB 3054]|uniref:hypothetical protein n=1 Tax=Paenibacillus sp. IHBB 3054 TaxID=3425689 RepID=UPI003F674837